jgi:hypothetical protein
MALKEEQIDANSGEDQADAEPGFARGSGWGTMSSEIEQGEEEEDGGKRRED